MSSEISTVELERLAAHGWRGTSTHRLGEWLLRAGSGFTGRANSVLPLRAPGLPLDDALGLSWSWYAARGLPLKLLRLHGANVAKGDPTLDARQIAARACGIDPAAVLRAATEAPARALGRDDLGRIAPDAAADLVWWDDDWVPRRVWLRGVEITDGR